MAGSSQSSGEQGIDQILAQIRKVIADEPPTTKVVPAVSPVSKPALPHTGQATVAKSAVSLPQPHPLPVKLPAPPDQARTLPTAGVTKPAVAVAAKPATPSKPTPLRPPDDLSDLIDMSPVLSMAPVTSMAKASGQDRISVPSAEVTSTTPKAVAAHAPLATAPVGAAPVIAVKSATPMTPLEQPGPATSSTARAPDAIAAVPPRVLQQAALLAPQPHATAQKPVPPPLPAKPPVSVRPLDTPPLLGDHGGGKAPMSLANMVANGSISMPSGLPSAVQPPNVAAVPSPATAVPVGSSSALGDLAAGLAASGQAIPGQAIPAQTATKTVAIPVALEDKILEGLRPTVRQWLEANAEALVQGTQKK